MTLRLVVKEDAVQDMAEAVEWYERQRLGLGAEFLNEVEECFSKIIAHPNRFPKNLKASALR
jgi:hypothetical protein